MIKIKKYFKESLYSAHFKFTKFLNVSKYLKKRAEYVLAE